MGKLSKNQAGFNVIEVVLALVIVALIGVVGYMVYKNQNKTTAATTNTTTAKTNKSASSTPKTNATPAAQATPFVNVIQDDSSVIQLTPDKIAKTTDETNILTALHNSCAVSPVYVTVNHAVFDSSQTFIQDGIHAIINATPCDNIAKTVNDFVGSGSGNYLHKNSSGTWILDASSQMAPNCIKVDGLGYPTSIISSCYDGSTPRAPK